jgi:hypothetical protein
MNLVELQKALEAKSKVMVCLQCKGQGKFITDGLFHYKTVQCEDCKGSGKVDMISLEDAKQVLALWRFRERVKCRTSEREKLLVDRKQLSDELGRRQKDFDEYEKLAHWKKKNATEDEKIARVCWHRVRDEIKFLKELVEEKKPS